MVDGFLDRVLESPGKALSVRIGEIVDTFPDGWIFAVVRDRHGYSIETVVVKSDFPDAQLISMRQNDAICISGDQATPGRVWGMIVPGVEPRWYWFRGLTGEDGVWFAEFYVQTQTEYLAMIEASKERGRLEWEAGAPEREAREKRLEGLSDRIDALKARLTQDERADLELWVEEMQDDW